MAKAKVKAEPKAMKYELDIRKLKGGDYKIFSSCEMAIKFKTFGKFLQQGGNIEDLFKLTDVKIGKEFMNLSHYYKQLDMEDIIEIFDEHVRVRAEQFDKLRTIAVKEFKNLDEYSKKINLFLYKWGDKVGGYAGVSLLESDDFIQMFHTFSEFEEQEIKEINNRKNNKGALK